MVANSGTLAASHAAALHARAGNRTRPLAIGMRASAPGKSRAAQFDFRHRRNSADSCRLSGEHLCARSPRRSPRRAIFGRSGASRDTPHVPFTPARPRRSRFGAGLTFSSHDFGVENRRPYAGQESRASGRALATAFVAPDQSRAGIRGRAQAVPRGDAATAGRKRFAGCEKRVAGEP